MRGDQCSERAGSSPPAVCRHSMSSTSVIGKAATEFRGNCSSTQRSKVVDGKGLQSFDFDRWSPRNCGRTRALSSCADRSRFHPRRDLRRIPCRISVRLPLGKRMPPTTTSRDRQFNAALERRTPGREAGTSRRWTAREMTALATVPRTFLWRTYRSIETNYISYRLTVKRSPLGGVNRVMP
jgi:hypothetical protein